MAWRRSFSRSLLAAPRSSFARSPPASAPSLCAPPSGVSGLQHSKPCFTSPRNLGELGWLQPSPPLYSTVASPGGDLSQGAFRRTCQDRYVLMPMEGCSISSQIRTLKLQSSQVRIQYLDGISQPFTAVSRGCSSFPMVNLTRAFSSNINPLPLITDPDIEAALKDLLAINWDEIPETVINETKTALSKATEDKAGQEALANVFRAAEASVEFSGVLVSLRMALDDLCGLSGENVGHLPEHLEDAIRAAYKRYVTYLDSFSPDETYLKKKVELELGTKMIHLKMRCSGIGSEWGKVTLLGTSGLSGSYVELRS